MGSTSKFTWNLSTLMCDLMHDLRPGAIILAKTSSSVVITGALSLIPLVTKLGHSCQEGLAEPPRATKKKQVIANDSDVKPAASPTNTISARSLQDEKKWQGKVKVVSKSRTQPAKRNFGPRQPDKMGEDVNTTRNFHHIEPNLESTKSSKKPTVSKTVPNFDLQLATLKHSRSPTPSEFGLTDDELPLISEVWEPDRDNTKTEIDRIQTDSCGAPPPKRSKLDVAAGLSEPSSRKKVYRI